MGSPRGGQGRPSGSSLTYANREQRNRGCWTGLLMPMRRIEGGLVRQLIARPQVVKLNPAGLLRADLAARYQSYKTAADDQHR